MTLHYQFPTFYNIDEILPLFENNENYIIAKKEGYTVINYVRSGKETHPIIDNNQWYCPGCQRKVEDIKSCGSQRCPEMENSAAVLREARGLIFDSKTGNVIARRFHKFFNLGEREDVMEIDLSKPHVIMEKLDGSMITPIPLNREIHWGTKMGLTDVAAQAEAFVSKNPKYVKFAENCIMWNLTPIFEWTSRQQRIVIDYPEDNLVLLAVRENFTGKYWERRFLEFITRDYDIPLVKVVASGVQNKNYQEELVNHIRSLTDVEGFVIQFEDGHMVKIKSDEYCSLHRAKSLLDNERDVVGLILDDKVDDLYPLLIQTDQERLKSFAKAIHYDISVFRWEVNLLLSRIKKDLISRKDFALGFKDINPSIRSMVFANWDDDSLHWERVYEYLRKHLGSSSQFEKCKNILKTAKWKVSTE